MRDEGLFEGGNGSMHRGKCQIRHVFCTTILSSKNHSKFSHKINQLGGGYWEKSERTVEVRSTSEVEILLCSDLTPDCQLELRYLMRWFLDAS